MYRSALLASLIASPAMAQNIVTDIAPVGALIEMATGAAPTIIVPPGADPHGFALRPSDAQALASADYIIIVSPEFLPPVGESIAAMSGGTPVLSLLDTTGWEPIPLSGHDEDHGDEDDHDHDHDHDHDDNAGTDHDDHAGHDHGDLDIDPHAWLDPSIARIWLAEIASVLDVADIAEADASLAALDQELATSLAGQVRPIIWPHQGYDYLQRRYDLTSIGAIAVSDGEAPGPGRISDLQELARAQPVCILSDANVSDDLARLVGEGADANYAEVSTVGTEGDDYLSMMRRFGDALSACTAS